MRLTASSLRHRGTRASRPPQHAVRGFRSIRWPVELPFSPDPGCTAQPRVHGSKYHLNPSSWAGVVPIPRLRPASPEAEGLPRDGPRALQSWCSCPSTSSPRPIRSRVSLGDLKRAPTRCSVRPVHRSKLQVAACSRGDASHGLFVTSPCRPARRQRTHNAISGAEDGLYSSRLHLYRAVRLSHERVGPSITSIRAHGPE